MRKKVFQPVSVIDLSTISRRLNPAGFQKYQKIYVLTLSGSYLDLALTSDIHDLPGTCNYSVIILVKLIIN